MKVLCIPFGVENPYQILLNAAISRNGVNIVIGDIHKYFSLSKSIKKYGKPDIIHLHWASCFILDDTVAKTIIKSISFLYELLWFRLQGIIIIWTIHNIVSHESKFPSLELFFNRLACLFCNQLIVHSISQKREVINNYRLLNGKSINVVPLGNYINYYENNIDRLEARNKLGIVNNNLIFCYFGAVRPYKGIPDLIDSFNKLCESTKTRDMNLLIVGKPLNDQIKKDINTKCNGVNNIIADLRFVEDNEIQVFMNAADFIVLPFRKMLTTSSAVLAMSFKKPIVAPLIGNVPDILDEEGGILYSPKAHGALLNAMEHALKKDPILMGEYNYRKVEAYRWEDIGKMTLEVYKK